MSEITYCFKTDCDNNTQNHCVCDMLSINKEGFCTSFEKKEKTEINPDFRPRHPDDI